MPRVLKFLSTALRSTGPERLWWLQGFQNQSHARTGSEAAPRTQEGGHWETGVTRIRSTTWMALELVGQKSLGPQKA